MERYVCIARWVGEQEQGTLHKPLHNDKLPPGLGILGNNPLGLGLSAEARPSSLLRLRVRN